ncbi:MAG: FMN-binding protein, partial [Actinomycetota bacterium]|nr:FMN-binding protein [Actinomycetota bacterium]
QHANPSAARQPPEPVRGPARRAAPPGVRTAIGAAINTPFTTIQVQATLTHGRLTGVRTLVLSSDSAHTEALNRRAEPILRREALRAHSAEIDAVSGATYTSTSWRSSLRSAIRRAGGE